MDVCARKVLKSKKRFILENLILNDAILDHLEDQEILNEDMVQQIAAERTDNQKINKLLYILKRRGQTAFHQFLDAIKQDFNFVSEVLKAEYENELDNLNSQDSSPSDRQRHSSEENTSNDETERENWNKVQTSVGTQTFEVERNKNSDFMKRMMQESFRCWYTKIKSHMTNRNLRELSFRSPEPVTYDMVDQLIDEMISTIEGCYKTLRVKDNLVTHVIELKESKKKMKKELNEKDQLKNKYADNIIKLENRCRHINEMLEEEKRHNQKLHDEFESLKEKLEAQLKEKDLEIDELKKQLQNALLKTNEGIKMVEREKKVKPERENCRQNALSLGRETEQTELTRQGTWQKSKRARSVGDYQMKQHISYYKSSYKNIYQHDKSREISKKASRQMTHSNGRESKELTAVEEPDGVNLVRTQSFVELCNNRSSCQSGKLKLNQSQNSDEEDRNDHNVPDTNFHQLKTNEICKEQQQIFIAGNNSDTTKTLKEQNNSTQSKKVRGRRNSHIVKPRKTNLNQQRVWFGTHENNQEAIKKAGRHVPNEPRNLSSLVVVNNNKCPLQESPRGAKIPKKHP
ncbi:synaptonemal complex protein 1-like [Ruditapes philippinarum]|uniref:synaptonemal complex protein 1-like n=1 Tax=Ruditapes philippinarum TaxID=129788 RepID=UPI00295B01C3|nr:synaptonemal complex protein 1-like [Ruditapes philippinarum]